MKYDVFVSYSTQDKTFVDALVNKLESQRIRCWYAPRDIPPGTTWPKAITEAIANTALMLLVFSGSANDSQEVAKELTLASSQKCLVLPVRIENVTPSDEFAYHLTNKHWLDVYGMEVETAINSIFAALEKCRGMTPQAVDLPLCPTHLPQTGVPADLQSGKGNLSSLKKNLFMPLPVKLFVALATGAVLLGLIAFFWGREVGSPVADAKFSPRQRLDQRGGNSTAQFTMGKMLYEEEKDYKTGMRWFLLAADNNNVEAMTYLGDLYYSGSGVKSDFSTAAKWYAKAAEKNYAPALYSLGEMCLNGFGVAQDPQKGVDLLKKAALQGYAPAQYTLGVLYENGQGFAQSYPLAFVWYLKAAKNDNADAQYKAGFMYHNGLGVEKNRDEARRWLQEAAAQGDSKAEEFLKQLP